MSYPPRSPPRRDLSTPSPLHERKATNRAKKALNQACRTDNLYRAAPGKGGHFQCPFKSKKNCRHGITLQKCVYDKWIDSHLRPFKCLDPSCPSARFSSTACLLRHERERHALHGHGNRPYHCLYENCARAVHGQGFPRLYNLMDHMRRMHKWTQPDAMTDGHLRAAAVVGRAPARRTGGGMINSIPLPIPMIAGHTPDFPVSLPLTHDQSFFPSGFLSSPPLGLAAPAYDNSLTPSSDPAVPATPSPQLGNIGLYQHNIAAPIGLRAHQQHRYLTPISQACYSPMSMQAMMGMSPSMGSTIPLSGSMSQTSVPSSSYPVNNTAATSCLQPQSYFPPTLVAGPFGSPGTADAMPVQLTRSEIAHFEPDFSAFTFPDGMGGSFPAMGYHQEMRFRSPPPPPSSHHHHHHHNAPLSLVPTSAPSIDYQIDPAIMGASPEPGSYLSQYVDNAGPIATLKQSPFDPTLFSVNDGAVLDPAIIMANADASQSQHSYSSYTPYQSYTHVADVVDVDADVEWRAIDGNVEWKALWS